MSDDRIRTFRSAVEEEMASLGDRATMDDLPSAMDKAEKRTRPIVPNTKVYHLAVTFLGIIVILAILAQALLVWHSGDVKIPEGLVAIGSLAIGALAGMLSPTS